MFPVIVHETQYLVFAEDPRPAGKKTNRWRIRSRRSGDLLGTIAWYGAWRQYCFWPEPKTVFNVGCMTDINEFITKQMEARRT